MYVDGKPNHKAP